MDACFPVYLTLQWLQIPFKNQIYTNKGCQLKNVPTGWVTAAYISKEQEFKIVEEVRPNLFFIFRGEHTSSTFSCPFLSET